MKNLLAWTMMATCVWMTGCRDKSAQSAIEGAQPLPKTDSASMSSTESDDNASTTPPATFHPNKKSKGEKAKHGTASKSVPSSSSGSGNYVIQVSVFKSKSQAEHFASGMQSSDHTVYVAEVENPTPDLSGTYYRVRIGDFGSREEADAYGKSKGFDYWVDAKANDNMGGGSTSSSNAPVPSRPANLPAPGTPPEAMPVTPAVAPKKMTAPAAADPAAAPATTMPATKTTPVSTAPKTVTTMPATTTPAKSTSMTPAAPAAVSTPVRPEVPPVPRDIAAPAGGMNENDPMQSPFQREEYYQPKDSTMSSSAKTSSTKTSTTPAADTSSNRRTLPTW